MKLRMSNALIAIGLILCSMSCVKEGCDDPDASNFSEEANKNNGSCIYEGNATLWYNWNTSYNLENDGITELTFYIDSQIIGGVSTTTYWPLEPDCGDPGSISHRRSMGSDKTQSSNYYVHDQNGNDVWTGTLTFNAEGCVSIELEL